ncbi:MAG: type II toxin-antitoxin system Phd/YefM family antitoxin [Propionibacteriaceae bacterium]
MALFAAVPHAVSVTEAATRGVSSLVRAAEHGEDVVVERHGKAVAAIVSMAHLEEISRLEQDLRESVLLLARMATDSGARTDLDAAIETYGLDRAELEAELAADLAAGRE